MKRTILSLAAAVAIPFFASEVLCEEGAKGRQRIDADAPAERLGLLGGKILKAGFGQSPATPVRPRRIEMSGLPGIVRRVPQQYPTIQAGINASVHGDTVLVSEGTYFENIKYRGKRIIVASSYLLDQDTSHISRTIIDGSQGVDTGSVVCFVSGEDTNSVLCGFTVRGGYGTYIPAWDEGDGGGVFLWQSGGRLVRNIITGNHVEAPNAWGGGVSITGLTNVGQTLIMEDNIVTRNTVTGYGASAASAYGGGVAVYQSQFRLVGNVFEYDSSRALSGAGAGGVLVGLTADNQQAGVIASNVFRRNVSAGDSTSRSSGLFLSFTGATIIEDNLFEDNIVTSLYSVAYGGAIYVADPSATSPEKRITRNVIRRNRVTNSLRYAYGGAMYVQGAHVSVAENLIQDNISQAGIYSLGGGIYGTRWAGTIENNIISGNTGTYGGGIAHIGDPPPGVTQAVMHNTVCRNVAEFGGGFYGGSNTTSILLGNIFWDDSSSTGEIQTSGTVELHYSNIEGGWIGGTGNINVNPMFSDSLYRISGQSPCVAAGTDSMQIGGVWYRAPGNDFFENPRPRPVGTRPDIGAHEFQTTTGVENISDVPTTFSLSQNYPNPFNPTTVIEFRVKSPELTTLRVFDVLGREVATLVNEVKSPGWHQVEFDASRVASGVYLYRLESGGFSAARKLIVVR